VDPAGRPPAASTIAYAHRAEQAPPVGALLSGVHDRSRRRRRYHAGLAGVAVLAVAVLAAAAGPHLFLGRGEGGASTPRPGATATRATQAGQRGLAPPTYTVPVFPFVSTVRLPAEFGPPMTRLEGGVATLAYVGSRSGAVLDTIEVTVSDQTQLGCATGGGRVTVHGRPAGLNPGNATTIPTSICWQERAGQWVRIRATGAVNVQTMISVGNGLRDGTTPIPVPFSFDLLPVGLALDDMGPTVMSFRPADRPAPANGLHSGFVGELTILLGEAAQQDPDGRAVDVGGKPGWVSTVDPGGPVLNVKVDDAVMLTVQMLDFPPMTEPDLIRFAAGIHVLPDARAGKG